MLCSYVSASLNLQTPPTHIFALGATRTPHEGICTVDASSKTKRIKIQETHVTLTAKEGIESQWLQLHTAAMTVVHTTTCLLAAQH